MAEIEINLRPEDLEKIKQKAKEEAEAEFEKFKKFAFQGNMVQMAVAFILAAAFKNVITSISENLLMPVVNFVIHFLSRTTGDHWREITWTPLAGMTIEIGKFLGSFIDFIIMAVILYIIWEKIFGGNDESDRKD